MPARICLPEHEIVDNWVNNPSETTRTLAVQYGCSHVKIIDVLRCHLSRSEIDRLKRHKMSCSTALRPDLKSEKHREQCKKASACLSLEQRAKTIAAAIAASAKARKGKKLSPEMCKKFSLAHIGKHAGEKHPRWKGGTSKRTSRGEGWSPARKECLKRDNYICQICGIHQDNYYRQLDVHHKTSYFKFDNPLEANHLSNLVSLCHSCHMKVENGNQSCP